MAEQTQHILPDAVFDGQTLRRGLAVTLTEGTVGALVPADQVGDNCLRVKGTITPGFVDLQVNGGGGVLFNSTPTGEGLLKIAAAHRSLGTTAILPTVITDAPEVLERAAKAALEHRGGGLIGLHIEGPHIAHDRRGTHEERFITPLSDSTIRIVTHLRSKGCPVMITLAPEAVRPGQVAALAGTGAIVSIGHSDASYAQVQPLLSEGASCFTHLFNAMSPLMNRAPGVTGAALNSTVFAGIICDGVHVHDEVVAITLRARPDPDTLFIVSDAMPTVGGPDRFSLYGRDITVQGGRLVNSEGSLAGAHISMGQSVQRLVRHVGAPLERALRMAVTIPAGLMGQDQLSTLGGRRAEDVLVLGPDHLPRGTLAQMVPAAV